MRAAKWTENVPANKPVLLPTTEESAKILALHSSRVCKMPSARCMTACL
jgi:hypothetical protein